MKRICLQLLSAIAALLVSAYFVSYIAVRLIKPQSITTNDGPSLTFQKFYLPLRYLDARKPEWYSQAKADDFWLGAEDMSMNEGNGYLYFTWKGEDMRIFNGTRQEIREGDAARVHIVFELETLEDFTSQFVPKIDQIKTTKESQSKP